MLTAGRIYLFFFFFFTSMQWGYCNRPNAYRWQILFDVFFFSLFLLVVAFYSWQQPLDEAIINGANRQYASCAIQIAQKNNQWTEYEKAVILSRITDLFAAINLDYWRVDAFIDSTLVGIDGSKNEKKSSKSSSTLNETVHCLSSCQCEWMNLRVSPERKDKIEK